MNRTKYLEARGVSLFTPGERPLLRELEMRIEDDHVAIVGRNGVGKTSLLEVLADASSPSEGRVVCTGTRHLVPQHPAGTAGSRPRASPGEVRRELLEEARRRAPDFLLLDEPSQDLDEAGIAWLEGWLRTWEGGLLVVTHDRRILRLFSHFFVMAESGCRLLSGSFPDLLLELDRERAEANRKYAAELNRLIDREEHNAAIRRRRARKKAGGRVRELGRCPARIRLNAKRGYAQVYQGKREGVREQRILAARQWAKAARRALSVELPLALAIPTLAEPVGNPAIDLEGVEARTPSRTLFTGITLSLERERLGILGPNGSGKTTLLEIMTGRRCPHTGTARQDPRRIGYVSQHAVNWRSEESLLSHLLAVTQATDLDEVAQQLEAHRFPLALAERPLDSLSPGERTRAALICVFSRHPPVELLLLDEPTDQLDLFGITALERVLTAWPGGLVVVSHDREFLDRIGVTQTLELGEDSPQQ